MERKKSAKRRNEGLNPTIYYDTTACWHHHVRILGERQNLFKGMQNLLANIYTFSSNFI